jgi:hypothetical protein
MTGTRDLPQMPIFLRSSGEAAPVISAMVGTRSIRLEKDDVVLPLGKSFGLEMTKGTLIVSW